MQIQGKNPNTGVPMGPHECAVKLTPIFLMAVVQSVTKLDGETSALRSDLRGSAEALNAFFATLNESLTRDPNERDSSKVHIPSG